MRLKTTLNLLGQLLVRLLEKIDRRATQGADEFPSARACDLGVFALRYFSLAKPFDRRREAPLVHKFLLCARIIRKQLSRKLQRNRFGSMSGKWKRSTAEMVGHPQTKERDTGENKLRPKPPRHTSTLPIVHNCTNCAACAGACPARRAASFKLYSALPRADRCGSGTDASRLAGPMPGRVRRGPRVAAGRSPHRAASVGERPAQRPVYSC
jgi:ferredoxin